MAKFLFYDDQAINVLLQEEKPSGGAAVQAHGWMQGLLSQGHQVALITDLHKQGPLKEECKNIELHSTFDERKGIRWIRWVYYRFPYIYRKVKKINPDYLYQGIPSWHSFLMALLCAQLKIKFIQRISNDFLLDDRILNNYSRSHRFFQRLGIKLSYCILCQNDYQLEIIKREFPKKMVMKISNPFFLPYQNDRKGESTKEYIAWMGLFQYQKNLKLLFEIAKEFPLEKFAVAGKESAYIDSESIWYVKQLKALPNVEFVGFLGRKQIVPFLAKAKFLLNTSHYEGFSNTFLEAMAAGTPILTSDKVNPDFIISKYGLGMVYSSPEDLKNQFENLNPDVWDKMAQNCLDFVSDNHDYKRLAEKLFLFLKSSQN